METLKILERPDSITWEYDQEADVLYLSVGAPESALSLDLGDGLVARYNEKKRAGCRSDGHRFPRTTDEESRAELRVGDREKR